ncbi:MAG: nucleotidyltransferase substrate binding protein [Melioribacteraceae bacterium]|nr:nucleotidyltransferase substrate binding protein [Melioribacteraceae bacterium]
MSEQDIRWKQRFKNYSKAFENLKNAVLEVTNPTDLEKEGTIQRFEFTHELAWKVMKDYLEYEGITGITGSRSATREAFNKGLISNGEVWMAMIESRNNTVHTYQKDILQKEYSLIVGEYYSELESFHKKIDGLM